MDHFPLDTRAGAHCRAARCVFHAGPDILDAVGAGVAGIIEDFSKVRHHVRGDSAGRDDIMDARILGHVLVHHVDHVVERLNAIEGRAPALRRASGMGGYAIEAELGRAIGERGLRGGGILVVGVPMEGNIDIVEQALADHVDLAAAPFFGGGAVQADRARRAGLLQPVADGQRGPDGARAEQVVPAGMAHMLAVNGLGWHPG